MNTTVRPALQTVCTVCGAPQPLQKLVGFRRPPGARQTQLLCADCLDREFDDESEDSPNDAA
jgi:hypothetical protein